MISRAEATDRLSEETAEASMRAFEVAVGQAPAISESNDEPDKVSSEAPDEMVSQTEESRETSVGVEKEESQAKGSIEPGNPETRLEFLARMYQERKVGQSGEEAEMEDTKVAEE